MLALNYKRLSAQAGAFLLPAGGLTLLAQTVTPFSLPLMFLTFLKIGAVLARGLSYQRLVGEVTDLQKKLDERFRLGGVRRRSSAWQRIHSQIEQVAQSRATVLIVGETGTGKGEVAKAVHFHSRRRDGPLVEVNCGALPEGIVESADEDADRVARRGDPPLGGELVPLGPDEDLLDGAPRRPREGCRDMSRLRPGQEARARPHPEGSSVAHRRPFLDAGAPPVGRSYSPPSSLKRALTTAARVSRSEASPSFRPIVGLWRILWSSVSVILSTTARSSGERRESFEA